MKNITHFKNMREENSSDIPAQWIYLSINIAFKLLSTNQIALNKCRPTELELL